MVGAHEDFHWVALCARRESAAPRAPRDYAQVPGSALLALSRRTSDTMPCDDDGIAILGT